MSAAEDVETVWRDLRAALLARVAELEAALERYRSGAEQQKAWRARTDEALRRFERPLGVPTWEVAAEWVARAEVAEAALEVSVPLSELEQVGWLNAKAGYLAKRYPAGFEEHEDGEYFGLTEPVYRRVVAPVTPESEE